MSIWIPQKLASIIRIIVSLIVCKGLGQGQQLDVVYTNHEKACDHLDHRISLDKSGILKYKTFSNKIFVFGWNWKSFAIYRMLSKWKSTQRKNQRRNVIVTKSYQWRSILDSHFFLIFPNDLSDYCKNFSLIIGADDPNDISIELPKMNIQ